MLSDNRDVSFKIAEVEEFDKRINWTTTMGVGGKGMLENDQLRFLLCR